jgi:hypothetical protein
LCGRQGSRWKSASGVFPGIATADERQQPAHGRSKIFEKSEKKSCHPMGAPLFLTAKPNPTNGETNDKKRAL